MKIGIKIFFGFIIIVILFGFFGAFSYFQLYNTSKIIDINLPLAINELSFFYNLKFNAQLIKYYDEVLTQSARNYAFTSDNKWKIRYFEVRPSLDLIIKEAIKNENQRTSEILKKINETNLVIAEMEINSINLVDEEKNNESIKILESIEYKKKKVMYDDLFEEFFLKAEINYGSALESSTVFLKLTKKDIGDRIKNNVRFIIISLIFSIIFSIFIAYFFSESVRKPVNEMVRVSKEVEKGNFKARVNVKSKDELGFLGKSFNKTVEALEKLDDEHKEIDKSKTLFLSITGHELRSPMTPMKAQLQMLLGDYFGKLNEKQKESIDSVLRNTNRLDNLIGDLLEISRIKAARLNFNFMKTSLNSYIEMTIAEMKGFMPEKKIKFELKVEKLPVIKVDPDRTMQVLRNLLNNAIKFSKNNENIEISAQKKGNFILFSVKDYGVEIADYEQKRIFEPFFQSAGMYQKRFGGTGLGLAICKGIVESQKGKIWFESKSEKGTTFFFTIPLVPVRIAKIVKLTGREERATGREERAKRWQKKR